MLYYKYIYGPCVYKAPLITAGNLVELSVDVQSDLPVGFIDTTEFVAFSNSLCGVFLAVA